MAVTLPPVPYGATAIRPDWMDLPAPLRAAVAARLGGPVLRARTAGGGFTSGFAGVLETSDNRGFVKVTPLDHRSGTANWYARELAVTSALPEPVAAPRPRWSLTVAGHLVVCLDAVDGTTPGLPWRPAELTAVLAGWAHTAAALAPCPPALTGLGLPRLAEVAREDLSWWREVARGRENAPPLAPTLAERIPELVALERLLPGYVGQDAVIHGDLRLDNVIIGRTGQVWFCDWTWACHGPAWFDTAGLLITAYASGLDADALFAAHPTAEGIPSDALDAALAALAGHWLTAAGASRGEPNLRAHQWWSGRTALAWLADRRGWPSS